MKHDTICSYKEYNFVSIITLYICTCQALLAYTYTSCCSAIQSDLGKHCLIILNNFCKRNNIISWPLSKVRVACSYVPVLEDAPAYDGISLAAQYAISSSTAARRREACISLSIELHLLPDCTISYTKRASRAIYTCALGR